MPRPGEYSPARRNLMQGIMWVILALTIALAAMVTRSQRQAGRVELANEITSGNVSVRLPARWRARPRGDADPRVVAQAAEAPPGEPGRTVRVLCDRIEQPMSPLAYICQTFGVSMEGVRDREDQTVNIAGHPGIMMTVEQGRMSRQGPDVRKDIYACAVLPSLQVLVVHLSGDEPAGPLDEPVVEQIASAITIIPQPPMESLGGSITLPEGITLSPPSGFTAVAQTDPNRSDRRLWRQISTSDKFEQDFVSIEVVGCLFPDIAANDPKRAERARSALVTMLLLRDQRWRDAKVSDEQGMWRADLPQSGEQKFPARAYLIPDPSGRAMLAVFTGGFEGGTSFDRLWKELAAKVKFLPASDSSQLQDAGAAEASRLLRGRDFDKFFDDRDEQWWQWTDASERPHLGWSHLQWEHDRIEARAETRLRRSGGDVTRLQHHWTLKSDGKTYFCESARTDRHDQEDQVLRQVCNYKPSQLSLSAQWQSSTAAQWKLSPPPAQYVPGQVLAQMMGTISAGPMLIRTESFLDADAIGPLEPLSIIIRPGENSARKAEGEDRPLRCVTAQVNGSGRISRWYFRGNGELESIDLPGGVRRVGSELTSIQFDFGHDRQMSP